ncbi:MAG: metallophosphoesterase [Bacteroidota bacterium]
MARRFVMGDIHGAYRALRQCLDRTHFDYEQDQLICLGDVCDGWPETKQCIDELLKIKNLTFILGNHDFHTLQWAAYGDVEEVWLRQGGVATQQSYNFEMPPVHIEFLKNAKRFWVMENRLFVHAGILPDRKPEECSLTVLMWDRLFVKSALRAHETQSTKKLTTFDEVYIGHTPIGPVPLLGAEVWMMDTGAGWSGVLSMMDIDTKHIFASDPVPGLYPGVAGRSKS